MRHTIDEAASLVNRTRRSIYRAMTEGRLAYGLEADGRRYIDTSELLRVYGPFESPSHDVTLEMSHGVTVPKDLAETIAKAIAKAVAEAVEPLRKEIELLRKNTRLIEHKLESPPELSTTTTPNQGSELDAAPRSTGSQKPSSCAPKNFADLLAGLDDG